MTGSVTTIVAILERYSSRCTAASAHLDDADDDAEVVAVKDPPSRGQPSHVSPSQEGLEGRSSHRLSCVAHPEDCVVKLLRLVANLAIHPEVGQCS